MDAVVKTIGKLKRQYMFLVGEEDNKSMFRTMTVQKKIDRRRESKIATDRDNSKPLPDSFASLMKGRLVKSKQKQGDKLCCLISLRTFTLKEEFFFGFFSQQKFGSK